MFRFDSTNDEEREERLLSSVAVVLFFLTGVPRVCITFFLRTTGTELS
jgi:hypothetical protein